MNCPNCGTELQSDWKLCPKCAYNISTKIFPSMQVQPAEPSGRSTCLGCAVILVGIILMMAKCGSNTSPTKQVDAYTSTPQIKKSISSISNQKLIEKSKKIEAKIAEDKELYEAATNMLGQVHALSLATGEDPSQLAASNGVKFCKQYHITEERMNEITKEGEKNDWPDDYDIGEALEKEHLRSLGYKFPGDF
jgi:hypothetical protein